ncbi:protein rep [Granulicella aggregans]|uniref:protein rep n=1 Tax=Granulicella aggregans TaxID=474949 RepID=UPI0021E0A103|nr:protein rep [Granulicella aggregans]
MLQRHGFDRDSIRVRDCYGWTHCKSAFCIKCASRRVWKQRSHLKRELPALLEVAPSRQLWFLTGAAEDGSDVRELSQAAMLGMNRIVRHPRLKNRVISSFSVLEIAHKTNRVDPCCHVHTLVVTEPMHQGRHRISEREWIELWEECCPRPRKRDPTVPLVRSNARKPKPNLSFVAERVPRTAQDIAKVIHYCTKWATPWRIIDSYRTLLANPHLFIERINALVGVTRFSGELHA